MALVQHRDEKVRFQQQVENTRSYVIPFLNESMELGPSTRILDIGCGDGGVMVPFLEMGCTATGIELDTQKSEFATSFLQDYVAEGKVSIVNVNIYEEVALERFRSQFDLIILKDVIEHIPDQQKFLPYLKQFLKPGGRIYLGFPPWYMPHGGHQQVCENKFLSVLPYFHLLPVPLYRLVLKTFGESEPVINELLEIKSTGISIERFERLARASGYTIENKHHYLINPIYRYKFGWKPRRQVQLISTIPHLRNYLTTCVYYLIRMQ